MVKIFAQSLSIDDIPGSIEGPVKFSKIGDIFNTTTMGIVFGFAGLGLLLMIVSAGFTLLTSAGDAKKLESGKQRLTYAIVGFLVIFVAYWGVQLAGKIFGVAEIQSVFK
ncbi:hypothetical protein HY339_02285 [Candidatus Gottesmanbacteria bacterium]|nr:hypothetical protein [Candidatus Gottesmanbacteria bacterium]